MATLDEIFGSTATPKNEFSGVTKQGAPGGEYYVPTSASPGGEGTGAVAKPSLDDIFATSPAGEQFLQSQKTEPGVDYTKGAPISVRYNVSRASNPDEVNAYLTGQYGAEGVKKDPGGNLLVNDQGTWVPVWPKGSVPEALKSGVAATGASAPEIAGGIAGGALGGPLGAAAGAGGSKLADEGVKALQGFYDKGPGELAADVGLEAGLAGLFQALPWLKPMLKNKASNILSEGVGPIPGLAKLGAVDPEARETVRGLQAIDPTVTPPLGGYAPGLKTFEYDRRIRNMLTNDPMAAKRIGLVDKRTDEVLQGFGLQGPQLDQARHEIMTTSEALSGRDVGREIAGRLRARENTLALEEAGAQDQALEHARTALNAVRSIANRPVGRLGEDVTQQYEGARRAFNMDMNAAYNRVDRMTGNNPVVHTDEVAHEAHNLLDTMDPQAVPPIIARLATGGIPMTFEEAHNLRTTLREMARVRDLSPIGQRRGNIMQMAGLIDDAIMRAEGQIGQEAAGALRQVDAMYARGINQFTNSDVNGLLREVRAGRMPNANEVADLLIDKESTDATRQLWGLLTPDVQQRVRVADLRNMLGSASAMGPDGREVLQPGAFLKRLEDRREVNEFLYPPQFIGHLRELAREFQAIGGTLDVTALQPGQVRQALERAVGAARARQLEADKNPRLALQSNDPEMVDAGARYFMKPGAEDRTTAGQSMLGPVWDSVQKFAIKDLLKRAIMPAGLSKTVSGNAMLAELGKYTPAQQAALFGARLPDVITLAKQAKVLFPELGDEMGGSLAAASIKGNLPKRSAIREAGIRFFLGRVADSPTLMNLVVGQAKADPVKARSTVNYVMNAMTEMGGRRFDITGQKPREPEPMMPAAPAVVPFKQFMSNTTPAAPREKSYGGPL